MNNIIQRTNIASLISIALLSALTLNISSIAIAQDFGDGSGEGDGGASGNVTPPAERFSTTPGGVDMRTGRYAYSATDLSVGESSEVGGLVLTRSLANNIRGHINPFANLSHNWDIFITEWRYSRMHGGPPRTNPGGGDFRISINFGGRSETFEANQTPNSLGIRNFEQASRSSYSTLTYENGDNTSNTIVYTMAAKDGTQIKFRPMGSADCSNIYRCAYASEVVLPDGTILNFEYESPSNVANQTRLRSITSSRGYALLMQYGGGADWNHVIKSCVYNLAIAPKPSNNICTSDALASATYTYITHGGKRKLSSVTDPRGDISRFTYNANKMNFIDPGQTVPRITNTLASRLNNELAYDDIVTRQDFADGTYFIMNYDEAPYQSSGTATTPEPIPELAGGTYTDAQGNTVSLLYGFPIVPGTFGPPTGGESGFWNRQAPINFGDIRYQTTPGPIVVTDSLGREWKSDYCDPAAYAGYPASFQNRCLIRPTLVSFEDPEGIVTEYLYDGNITRNIIQTTRKAKTGSGLADIVTSATYPSCSLANRKICTKPLSQTDAKGNVTDYEYDPVHGGVTRVRGPAVNGVRPETRYTYAQRYAWYKNASGSFVQSANPIWLLTSERTCTNSNMTATGCAGGVAQSVVTTYDYGPGSGPNNLLLRGTAVSNGGKTLRTCYGYDAYGRRISETQPKGTGSTCP